MKRIEEEITKLAESTLKELIKNLKPIDEAKKIMPEEGIYLFQIGSVEFPKYYIGKSKNFRVRINQHLKGAKGTKTIFKNIKGNKYKTKISSIYCSPILSAALEIALIVELEHEFGKGSLINNRKG